MSAVWGVTCRGSWIITFCLGSEKPQAPLHTHMMMIIRRRSPSSLRTLSPGFCRFPSYSVLCDVWSAFKAAHAVAAALPCLSLIRQTDMWDVCGTFCPDLWMRDVLWWVQKSVRGAVWVWESVCTFEKKYFRMIGQLCLHMQLQIMWETGLSC